jgi:hypothetical protein
MAQNDQNRDRDRQQGEGYQDPNEQDSIESRTDSPDSQPQNRDTGARSTQGQVSESDVDSDDLDDDEDRDDDIREGGVNRRRSIS